MTNNFKKDIKYWLGSSRKDFRVAQNLLSLKHYPHCLFFCHLSIEKLLKAITIKVNRQYPPHTHDLRKLAELANMGLSPKQEQILEIISTFNIAGRYADAKFKFYQKYNKKEYAQKYLKITKELLLWLRKEFQKR